MSLTRLWSASPGVLAFVVALPLALLAGGLVLWWAPVSDSEETQDGTDPSLPPPPEPAAIATPPIAEPWCEALMNDLPARLDGQYRRRTTPKHEQVVAWGEPATVLRCGVERPAEYTQSAQIIGVNGVDWVEREANEGTVLTAVSLPTYVEVRVPSSRAEGAAQHTLNPLAAPLLVPR